MYSRTAVTFGRTNRRHAHLKVITVGGTFLPPPTGVEPARLVRLSLDPRATQLTT